jgi:signal transduction histidine kinase
MHTIALQTPLQAINFGTAELLVALSNIESTVEKMGSKQENVDFEYLVSLVPKSLEIARNLITYGDFMNLSINRSLDFTKSVHGIALSPVLSAIQLTDAIHYPVSCVRATQQRVQIVIDPVEFPSKDSIITDVGWLRENLICLLSNAIKYSVSTGEIHVRCKLKKSHKTSNEFLRFEVEDHGVGVSASQVNSFLSKSQTENRTGGNGLGLYSLSKRIGALGGEVGFEGRSDGSAGTLVWFTIPLIREESIHKTATTTKISLSKSGTNRRILIVDDSHMVRVHIMLGKLLLCSHFNEAGNKTSEERTRVGEF